MKATRFALGAAAAAALALACAAQAQTRSIASVPQTNKSVNTTQAQTFGLPRASGLTSPFPAGLTAGSGPATGAATTTTSNGTVNTTTTAATSPTAGNVVIQNPNTTVIGTNTTTTTVDGQPVTATPTGGVVVGNAGVANATAAGAYPATNVMGAGAAGGPTLRQGGSLGAGPYTAVEVASSFVTADANGDRELTRAEATRLALMPYSFEEMDLNHDGVVTRFEYEEALRR
jgi:hypothetical protein